MILLELLEAAVAVAPEFEPIRNFEYKRWPPQQPTLAPMLRWLMNSDHLADFAVSLGPTPLMTRWRLLGAASAVGR